MVRKVKCYCGCGSLVSASTERRHRAGKATPRVKASHAARQTIYAPKHLSKKVYSENLLPGCSSTPDIPSQPPGNDQMAPGGIPNMDADVGVGLNVEIEPNSTSNGTWNIAGVSGSVNGNVLDDIQVSDAIANVRGEAWRARVPTIEDYASDDEDDEGGSRDDEDDFDWHAEMSEDDETYVDGGLGVDDMINEDFERDLARFGIV
jgi:hypothetical protein